jgi:pterin-4a-carbinolamine dehydratase
VFNDLSLSVWICDDGSLHEKVDGQRIYYSYRIHTESFTISEVDRLRKLLLDKYNIESTKCQRENCSGYVINISKQDSVHKLSELISPYVPKSLRYKVKPEHREVEYIFPELDFSYDLGVVYIPITHHKVAEYGGGLKKRSKASYAFKYDIEVEGYHNFVANNTIVHNSKWGEPVPTTRAAAAKLAAKGRSLLEKAKRMKESRKRVKASINSTYEQYSIPSKNPDDYLVVEDRDKVSTYHLQVKENGVPNPRLMGAAWRALYHPSGHRGNPYKGPQKDKAKRKLRALYKSLGREMPRVQRHSLFSSSDVETGETSQELSTSLRLRNFIYNLVEKPLRRGTTIQNPVLRKLTSDEHVDSNVLGFDADTLDYQQTYFDLDESFDELLTVLENSLSELVNSDKYSNCSKETLELASSISKDIILSLLGLNLSESDFTEALDESEYYLSDLELGENRLSVLNTESYSLEEVDLPDEFVFLTTVNRDCILRKYTFSDYSHAISFVNDIYNKAEEVGHHPIELLTIYNSPITEVYVKLSTNDEQIGDITVEFNTVTLKDINLANYCNSIYETHYKNGLSDSRNEDLSNNDDIELTNYYIDQLNMALNDLKLSKEIDLDDYEAYSENIFLDKDKHQQAKAEAKLKFRVYPSVYANMWMVKRYKELGGRFAKRD